jgi:hypothetical protein
VYTVRFALDVGNAVLAARRREIADLVEHFVHVLQILEKSMTIFESIAFCFRQQIISTSLKNKISIHLIF